VPGGEKKKKTGRTRRERPTPLYRPLNLSGERGLDARLFSALADQQKKKSAMNEKWRRARDEKTDRRGRYSQAIVHTSNR